MGRGHQLFYSKNTYLFFGGSYLGRKLYAAVKFAHLTAYVYSVLSVFTVYARGIQPLTQSLICLRSQSAQLIAFCFGSILCVSSIASSAFINSSKTVAFGSRCLSSLIKLFNAVLFILLAWLLNLFKHIYQRIAIGYINTHRRAQRRGALVITFGYWWCGVSTVTIR